MVHRQSIVNVIAYGDIVPITALFRADGPLTGGGAKQRSGKFDLHPPGGSSATRTNP